MAEDMKQKIERVLMDVRKKNKEKELALMGNLFCSTFLYKIFTCFLV
jgi:hypothetical protein